MPNLQRIYWDACAWIAYINQEDIPQKQGPSENRYRMCKGILTLAKAGKVELVTSAFTLSEVCKSPEIKSSPADNLPAFFDSSYILLVPVDKTVGQRAQQMQLSGLLGGLKPADATHLASAVRADVKEFHTFDDRLLAFDGRITMSDGQPMTICKPGELKLEGLFAKLDEEE